MRISSDTGTVLRCLGVWGLACLAGCASDPGTPGTQAGRCNDSRLGWAVGQPGNEANLKRLWDESGAGLMNPIAPTTVVKRDSRTDRLRVYLDKDNVITAARCE